MTTADGFFARANSLSSAFTRQTRRSSTLEDERGVEAVGRGEILKTTENGGSD